MRKTRFAFFADNHIGYRYADRSDEQGVNLRVVDGYNALREITAGVIKEHREEPLDGVIHGGDLFHVSNPTIRDIMTVQHYLRLIAKEGIPFYGLAGNHDASDNRSDIAAVGVLNDPDRNIHALYAPYETYHVADGIVLHSVSHHGHKGESSPEVKGDPSKINIFTTHGAAADPKNATLLRCLDSPREQIIPNEMVLSELFTVRLLGHYHSRYAVGGKELNTWYSGSTLRRGFSDEPGDRGWLLVEIYEDGTVEVFPRNIRQRPQYDFTPIDASELRSGEIQDIILDNLNRTRNMEKDGQFDPLSAPILRQRVINADRSVREGIDRVLLSSKASHALRWQLEFMRPQENAKAKETEKLSPEEEKAVEEAINSPTLKKNSGAVNIENQYLQWASSSATLASVKKEDRPFVGEEGRRHLRNAEEKENS